MIRPFYSKQFFLFILTGGFAAAVNFTSRIIFNQWFSFSISIIFAYIAGMITAYLLAKFFVFKGSKQSASKSIFWFIAVNVFAVMQTLIVSIFLASYLLPLIGVMRWKLEIAHAIGVILPVFTSYVGHKKLSFR